jgi:hypothetical protein
MCGEYHYDSMARATDRRAQSVDRYRSSRRAFPELFRHLNGEVRRSCDRLLLLTGEGRARPVIVMARR